MTLHDVAEKLGLSVTQTSRALNDRWDVAESTKARARAVAEELGYVPNLEARRLKTGSTRADAIQKAEALALRALADRLEHGEDVPAVAHLFANA